MMKIALLYLTILSLMIAQDVYPTVVFDTTQPLEVATNTLYVSSNDMFNINGTTAYSYRIPLVAYNLYMLYWGSGFEDFLFVIEDQTGWNHLYAAANNFDMAYIATNVLIFELKNSGFYNITVSYVLSGMVGGVGFSGWGIFDVPRIIPGEEYSEEISYIINPFYAGFLDVESDDLDTIYWSTTDDKCLFKFNPLNSWEDYRFHPCNHETEIILDHQFTFNETGRYILYDRWGSFGDVSIWNPTTVSTRKISGFSYFGIGMIIGTILVLYRIVRNDD